MAPGQIVPRLADQGRYLASESSFYRILRAQRQQHHRGRAKPPAPRKPPTSHRASGPCQVWTWDITWLPGPIAGIFFYLYLIVDIYSRKIVGWEVYARESAEYAAIVVRLSRLGRGLADQPARSPCRQRQPDEGRDLEGDVGPSRRHRLLQPPAGEQRHPLLGSPVPDLQVPP